MANCHQNAGMAKSEFPSQNLDKFVVRLPEGMRERLAQAAKTSNRSMNSEIVARLEESFPATLPEHEVLKQLYDEHLRQLRTQIIAAANATRPGYNGAQSFELPDTPEELAALVEARVQAELAYKKTWTRVARLFRQTDEILRAKQAKLAQANQPPYANDSTAADESSEPPTPAPKR